MHSGYTYYLQTQFIVLCIIILFQAGVGPQGAGLGAAGQLQAPARPLLASAPALCYSFFQKQCAGGRLGALHLCPLLAPPDGDGHRQRQSEARQRRHAAPLPGH